MDGYTHTQAVKYLSEEHDLTKAMKELQGAYDGLHDKRMVPGPAMRKKIKEAQEAIDRHDTAMALSLVRSAITLGNC